MSKAKKYSPEVRERAVRMVLEVRKDYPALWSAVESVAAKIGCTASTLNEWVKRHQIEHGERDGQSSVERERVKALEREVKELRTYTLAFSTDLWHGICSLSSVCVVSESARFRTFIR